MADISLADIKKLRDMTSAGMMDCKKALTEAEGDFKRAVEILREKGKSTLAKRGDNETTQGAVLSRINGGKAILVCLGCETDFVAATPDFKALAASIADAAIAEFPADLAALKAVKTATGYTLDEDITNQAGKTGEKHILAYYAGIEAPFVSEYVHFNGKLGAIVAFNKEVPAEIARGIAMQVASMNPVAVDEASVPAEVLESEKTVAIQKTKDEQVQKAIDAALKAVKLAAGYTIDEDITNQAGKTGEKHVLAFYGALEAPFVVEYVHFNGKLGAIVSFNKEVPAEIARGIAMQVASMNPVAVDPASVPAEVLESERNVAIQKTRDELVQKAVDAALKKAGINPAHVDSEDHIESNTAKGWLTPEQANQAREIIKTVGAEKAASLPEQMIQNIANGRVQKFLKESTLVEQEYQLSDDKISVGAALAAADKEAKVLAFRRFSLAD